MRKMGWVIGYLFVFFLLTAVTRCGTGVGETEPATIGVMKF